MDENNDFTFSEFIFWQKVKKNSQNDCWEWQGCVNGRYGQLMRKGKHWLAHRYSWFLKYGYEPQLCLLHICDNRICVNPAHLREGTQLENMQDMVRKERQNRGSKNGHSILTESEVKTIKIRLKNNVKGSEIAKEFGVSQEAISGIKRGVRWSHIKI